MAERPPPKDKYGNVAGTEEWYQQILEERNIEIQKLEIKLTRTEYHLSELSDMDDMAFAVNPSGPSGAMLHQNKLLRKENRKLKVERNKVVRQLNSLKKKLLKLGGQ